MFYFYCFGQEKPSQWTFIKEQNDVKVFYKYAQCEPRIGFDQELVLLQFKNTSSSKKKLIKWDLEAYRDNECTTCNAGGEYHMELKMAPSQIIEGDCSLDCDYRLRIFSKFNEGISEDDQKLLTRFILSNLNVID